MKTNSLYRFTVMNIIIFILFLNFSFPQVKKKSIFWKGNMVEVVENEIGIKIKPNVNIFNLKSKVELLGFAMSDSIDEQGITKLKLPESYGIINAIEQILKTNLVEVAEPIVITRMFITPNDQYYSNQWGSLKIFAPSAWNITTGNSDITIGVLDSGIPIQSGSLSHLDLQNINRILIGNDYVGDGESVKDNNGHGTHVAGILSSETNNNIGIAGISWDTKLFVVQVFDDSGSGTDYGFYQGVVNAINNGARIINFSGGVEFPTYWLQQGVIHANNNNALIIAAAGNYHPQSNPNKIVEWPAAYSSSYNNVIAVSATTSNDVIADFSSRGSAVNVSAPGDNIYSTFPNYSIPNRPLNYGYNSGTSMAAPFVTGLAGLMKSINSSLTPSQIRNILQNTTDDLGTAGFDTLYGYGRINAYEALLAALPNYVNQTYNSNTTIGNIRLSGTTAIAAETYITIEHGKYVVIEGTINGTPNDSRFYINGTLIVEDASVINRVEIIVNPGGKLIAKPGVTFNMLYNGSFWVEGDFEAIGTSSNPIRFQPYSPTGIWPYINLVNKGWVELKHCIIDRSRYGIQIANYSGVLQIDYTTVSNSTYYGMNIFNSWIYGEEPYTLKRINLINNGWDGIRINNSGVYFGDWEVPSSCVITGNGRYGVYAGEFSDVSLGFVYYGSPPVNGGFNSIYNNSSYDLYSSGSITSLVVEWSWWGQTPPNSSKFYCDDCLVLDYNPWLDYNPNGSYQPNIQISNKDFTLAKVNRSITQEFNTEPSPNQNTLSEFISYIWSLRKENRETAEQYLMSVISDVNHPYLKEAKLLHLQDLFALKRFQEAITSGQQLLSDKNVNSEEKKIIANMLFTSYLFNQKDLNEANRMYDYLAQLGTEEITNGLFKSFIDKQASIIFKSEKIESNLESSKENLSFRLDNYPNPFNPSTTIRFSLPEAGFVKLVVYNMLGQEVETLINDFRNVGTYDVQWNASNLASGIYIYRLQTDKFVEMKKMILMK